MTPHLNSLDETVLMMGHNIHFDGVIWKIIPKLSLLPLLFGALKNDTVAENLVSIVTCRICSCYRKYGFHSYMQDLFMFQKIWFP